MVQTTRLLRLAFTCPLLAAALAAAEPPSARLVNISARVALGGTAGTPICGFVVAGSSQKQVIVRAAGPALGAFGVAGALGDPRLSLVATGGPAVASNDKDARAQFYLARFEFEQPARCLTKPGVVQAVASFPRKVRHRYVGQPERCPMPTGKGVTGRAKTTSRIYK